MHDLAFEWDDAKDRTNMRKHGVSFREAQSAFRDDDGREFDDDVHSVSETRFLLLARSSRRRLLMISYCLRSEGAVIRIISARLATKNERLHYSGGG